MFPFRSLERILGLNRSQRELTPRDSLRRAPDGLFVFIHINKTGGISVGKALDLPGKMHFSVREVKSAIGRRRWKRAFTFSIVRNPWDKVVSHYKYRVKTNQTQLSERPLPFADWVLKTYGPEKDMFYYDQPRMFQDQYAWLEDESGQLGVDKLIRFERLVEGFEEVALQLGITAKLPHLNKTDNRPYIDFYNEQSRDIVAQWFARDIKAFDYRFGD